MIGRGIVGLIAIAAAAAVSLPASATEPSAATTAWLGKEIVIKASEQRDHVPLGGRLTLIYDASDGVYRVCARPVATQRAPWRGDWKTPCGVTLNYTAGKRYCSLSDVKTGNADVLSSCHRLRSREVAMHPSADSKGVELHDMIVYLLEPSGTGAKGEIAILLDSPARVTHDGVIHGGPPH